MFTGIVETTGTLSFMQKKGKGFTVGIKTPAAFGLKARVKLGDSIACNGVCLTATVIDGDEFHADMSAETVSLTAWGSYAVGRPINLELACTPSTHLGGHIVQGHVDGVGEVVSVSPLDEAFDVLIACPPELMRYIALKGSIAADGVSLTVNGIDGDIIRLTLIPHTQSGIAFGMWQGGAKVNLEVDVLARYLERLMNCGKESPVKDGGLTLETLTANGFI